MIFLVPWLLSLLPVLTASGKNFEYEYTALISIALFTCYPHLLFYLLRWKSERIEVFQRKLICSLFIGIFPLLLTGISAFRMGLCPCSEKSFYLWFLINILPAWTSSHLLLAWAARKDHRRKHKVHSRLLLVQTLLFLFLAVSLWTNPQKRGFFAFLGYIHGPIYDEFLEVDPGMLYNAAGSTFAILSILFFLLAFKKQHSFTRKTLVSACSLSFLIGSLLIVHQSDSYPSSGFGKELIENKLSQKISHDSFTMFFDPSIEPSVTRRLFQEAHFHLTELKQVLAISEHPHIWIYVYADGRLKKTLFGAGETDVTDVYTPTVHITAESFPHSTLRHELVHALLSSHAPFGLGFHPNIAITEGFAEALAPRIRTLDLDVASAALISTGKLKNMENLFSPLFWLESGERSYTAAGSFLRYLMTQHGPAATLKLYEGVGFDKAFQKSRSQLIADWREHIMKSYDAKKHDFAVKAGFSSRGVLYELCPHTKALLRSDRKDDDLLNWQKPDIKKGQSLQDWFINLEPDNKRYQHQKLMREARQSLDHPTSLLELQKAMDGLASANSDDIWEHYLIMLMADIHCLRGENLEAEKKLKDLEAKANQVLTPVSYRLALQTRLEILTSPPEEQGEWCKMLLNRKKPELISSTGPWRQSFLELLGLHSPEESQNFINLILKGPSLFEQQLGTDAFHELLFKISSRLIQKGEFALSLKILEQGMAATKKSGYSETLAMLQRYSRYGENSL